MNCSDSISDNQPAESSAGVPAFPEAASGSVGPDRMPEAAHEQSEPPIGNAGEAPPAADGFLFRLAAGDLRRKYDGLLDDISRLAKDRCPDSSDYPDELFGLAERIRAFVDRL